MADGDNVVPIFGASEGPVMRSDEEIAADLLAEYLDAPDEVRRFVHRYNRLHRLQELDAPKLIIGNQKELVLRALNDLRELLGIVENDEV